MPYFSGMSQEDADSFRQGGPDAYGKSPERMRSDGTAPCRCCLKLIEAGSDMLVLAYRPFGELQPYAETGPVFLCANDCEAVVASPDVPEVVVSPEYLLKGYSSDERIVYGTGQITPKADVAAYANALLERDDIAFVDLRSAKNNCWQVRMTRR
ncbi:DUF1203 domain-containing protein [Shimia aestuarii]|uniref:DUF1203 domain-containing protein n=1 Tax=Shimia aestuarii TaxID=254406 RepID=UPI001FB3346E|nr:DUF1203 domain-containing protein [Shimia aestuarii]